MNNTEARKFRHHPDVQRARNAVDLTREEWTEILYDRWVEVRIGLAANQHAPASILAKMINDPIDVRLELAFNPSTPAAAVVELAQDWNPFVREATVRGFLHAQTNGADGRTSHQQIPADLQRIWLNDKASNVREAVNLLMDRIGDPASEPNTNGDSGPQRRNIPLAV